MREYFIGVSLGASANEKTAMVVIERTTKGGKYFHSVVITERFPLGSTFEAIAERVGAGYDRRRAAGDECTIILDRTGVGAPQVNLFRERVWVEYVIRLTRGVTPSSCIDDGYTLRQVPKEDVTGALQLVYQGKRYGIAEGLPDAETLARQAESFTTAKAKPGGDNDPAEREGVDDDILIAWAIACWAADTPAPEYLRFL